MGQNGMVIQMDNTYGMHQNEKFYDVRGISAYPEEDERLFCGSTKRLQLQSVIEFNANIDYKKALSALFKMDGVLSGTVIDELKVSSEEMELVKLLIGSQTAVDASDVSMVQPFVSNTFLCYLLKKTSVLLTLYYLDTCVDGSFVDIF